MSWPEFVSSCKTLLALADSWSEFGDSNEPGGYFIFSRDVRSHNSTLLSVRFDICYNLAFAVPQAFFSVSYPDGRSVSLDTVWELVQVSSSDLWSTVTQMDHPVVQTPFYAFHPCQTEKFLESVSSDLAEKEAYQLFISYISLMSSILKFPFPLSIIQSCSKQVVK